jgi:Transposase DDE domain
LYASEIVTLALLYSLKGCGQRAFWRWLVRDYGSLFPNLPDRTRLFRLFNSHRSYIDLFLAEPSLIGVIDSYGIELLHPIREGRSEKQIGRKGKSNKRWIVGGKLCYLLNHLGLIVAWACDTANVYDGSAFQQLVDDVADQMVVFADTGFDEKDWHPPNLRLCKPGEWNVRMLVETVLSMLTYVCDFKRSRHKGWDYFETKVGFTMALFNILVQWHGFQPDDTGFISLSIAEFSL